MGLAAGTNLFGYVGNNPISGIDPLGLDKYLGGSREGHGHLWAAVDAPSGGVFKYDYSANDGGTSSAFITDLYTAGQAKVTWFPTIQAAAGPNEFYEFPESPGKDADMLIGMLADQNDPPDYSYLTHSCVDASCDVAGFWEIATNTIEPQTALDELKQLSDELHLISRKKGECPP